MEVYCVNCKCAAFAASETDNIAKEEVKSIVKRLLREKSLEEWSDVAVDVFCAGGKYLYLAHPASEIHISIAGYAMPFFTEYFTE